MTYRQQFASIIEREGDGYVALCPELDIASQGNTVEEARRHLVEAIELFFETADPSEVQRRLHSKLGGRTSFSKKPHSSVRQRHQSNQQQQLKQRKQRRPRER